MSAAVIFKQSFKSRSASSSAGLNIRHLQYIATRPGAVYNRGCGFGLWGQLPGDGSIRIQSDLTRAKEAVREASQDHTLYRAILSVGQEDARQSGLYDRERWENLVGDHIRDIAREMDIKPENLCWCASFHCAKNHPHVHLLYWDSSSTPRQEFIPKHLWEAKAERIRAAFAGDIHREEIRQMQKDQRELEDPLRAAVRAMCREANPENIPDLPRLYRSEALGELSARMADLIRDLPNKGSLRYAYLNPYSKAQVDAMIDACAKTPDLRRELDRYERYTREISRLYGNGTDSTQAAWEKARDKLRRELGNQVVAAVREIRDELSTVPPGREEVQALIREAATQVAPGLSSYRELLSLLPPERIPVRLMPVQIDGYFEGMNRLLGDVLSDARIRLRLQSSAVAAAGIDLAAKPPALRGNRYTGQSQQDGQPPVLMGKTVTREEMDAYQKSYQEEKRELRRELTQQLRADAGWAQEALNTSAVGLLCGMVRSVSQAAYQRQAGAVQARNSRKTRSKDKSREAGRDYRAAQDSPSGGWDDGYN